MKRHPAKFVLNSHLPVHRNESVHLVIALPEGNALREEFEYQFLDVYIHLNGSLDVWPRYRDPNASPADKERGVDWNYPHTRITDLREIPVETRQEIQRAWETYLDTLAQVRDLSIVGV